MHHHPGKGQVAHSLASRLSSAAVVESVQLRVMVADRQEDGGVAASPQFAFELSHQQPRALGEAAASLMHRAAGAQRVAAEDGEQGVALVDIGLDAPDDVLRQPLATFDAGVVVQGLA